MAKGYSARGGFSGGGSAMRQQQMQQKLLKMQQDMAAAQEAVENASFTASVGGGVVQATVSGKKELTALTVKPEAVDPEDVEMLEDLVAATNLGRALDHHMGTYPGVVTDFHLGADDRKGADFNPFTDHGRLMDDGSIVNDGSLVDHVC